MARTKQTPRNPNINRPKAAIGSDIQPTKGRPTPRPPLSKTQVKGGKQPQKHLSWKYYAWVLLLLAELKNLTVTGLDW